MAAAVILLSVALMFFMAFASAVQRTIRALGLLRRGESEIPAKVRAHTVILLGAYLRWLNVAFLLGVAVYLVISRASAWYYGATMVALCWIGSLVIGGMASLRPESAAMVGLILADLERRRAWYLAVHNTARLDAVEDLLKRVRAAPGRHIASGLHR